MTGLVIYAAICSFVAACAYLVIRGGAGSSGMTAQFHRREWRDRRKHPTSLEDLHMSNRCIGALCGLSALGLALVLLVWFCGQPFINAILGFMP